MTKEQIENDVTVLNDKTVTPVVASALNKADNDTLHFIAASDGTRMAKNLITGASYPSVFKVNSLSFRYDTSEVGFLFWLHTLLKLNADQGHAFLTGRLLKQLANESRAGHSETDLITYLILDVDSDLPYATRNDFIAALFGKKLAYIFQHSTKSTGDDSLRGHYFLRLSEPLMPFEIKTWMKNANAALFPELIALSANGQGIKWPLDICINDSGRIVYIAPPIRDDEDPVSERIILCNQDCTSSVSLPKFEAVKTTALVDTLRNKQGLTKQVRTGRGKTSVAHVKTGEITITDRKQERGRYYFNLNGGDSWGYWMDPDNPRLIHNFKGEPNLLLEEVDSELYESLNTWEKDRAALVIKLKKQVVRTWLTGEIK